MTRRRAHNGSVRFPATIVDRIRQKTLGRIFGTSTSILRAAIQCWKRKIAFWCTNHINLIHVWNFCQRFSRFSPPFPPLTNSMLRRNVAFWCTNHLNLIYISSFCQRRSRFLAPFPPLQFNVEKKFRRRTGDCAGSPSLARGDSRGKDATPRDFRPQRSPTLNSKGGKGGGRQENPSTLRVGGGGHDEGYEVFWRIRVAGKRTDPLWARS